jgi:hypothetical protein
MITPRVSNLLFAAIATIALTCAPNLAFAQHRGRGSRGGGGSHSRGSRGGGHSHFGGGGGFLRGGGGHSGGKSFARGGAVAARQMSGRSYKQFGGLGSGPRTNSNFAFSGSRSVGSIGSRSIYGMTGQMSGARFARAVAPGTHAAGMSFNSNRPPNGTLSSRSWSGRGQSSWVSTPRSLSSFNSNRPPNGTLSSRSWSGRGQSSWVSTPRSSSSFNPNRPPDATSSSRSWSGRGQSSRASTTSLPSSLGPNHGLSNFGNSRFDNSAFGHSSLSNSRSRFNSRARSSVSRFAPSKFGDAHPFDLGAGATSFNGAPSFGGDEFSFVPGLFGLALDLGGFGLRGLSLLGSGLTGFGLQSLDLLGSGSGGFSPDASLESRRGATGSGFFPTENLTCPQ